MHGDWIYILCPPHLKRGFVGDHHSPLAARNYPPKIKDGTKKFCFHTQNFFPVQKKSTQPRHPIFNKDLWTLSVSVLPFLVWHFIFELFITLFAIALALALLPLDVAEGLARLADRVHEGPGNLKVKQNPMVGWILNGEKWNATQLENIRKSCFF